MTAKDLIWEMIQSCVIIVNIKLCEEKRKGVGHHMPSNEKELNANLFDQLTLVERIERHLKMEESKQRKRRLRS